MSNTLLTLAMSQTFNDNFKVIAYDLDDLDIKDIDMSYDQIRNGSIIYFDIGGITEAENLEGKRDARGNITYTVNGNTKLIGYKSKNELKDLFEAERGNYIAFSNDNRRTHVIEKVDALINITFEGESQNIKSRIQFLTRGKTSRYLVKDYRWVSYWKHLNTSADIESKKLSLIKNFKEKTNQRNIYIILYRYYFENNSQIWIAGFHYL